MNYNLYTQKYALLVLICTTMFILEPAKNVSARIYFHMERPLLGLGFIYQFDNEKRTGPDINFQSERHDFRERLSVESDGWIYHPAFCEYNFDFRPELNQRREENGDEKASKNAFLNGYSLRTTFLPTKPYSLILFGRRQNIPSLSAFSTVSDTDFQDIGGILRFTYPVLPTTLTYTRSKEDQTGFYKSREESNRWELRSNHIRGNSITRLGAIYEEIMRISGNYPSDIDRFDGSLLNSYTLKDRKIIFTSFLSQRLTDDNDLKTSGIRFNENIDWEHRKNLSTNYHLLFDRNTSGDIFNETQNIGARLKHRLYENLTTNILGDIYKKDFTTGTEDSYVGDLRFNYFRPIPYGTLGVNMGFNYRLRSSKFDENYIPIINEPQILTGISFTFLDNKFIVINSIKVTDVTGTKVYIKDIDYELDEINFFVRIRRLIGSSIADGEQVLVSYDYLATTPSYDDSTFAQSYGFNLDLWSTLLLSYQYRNSKQKILSGTPPDRPEDDTEHSAKIELLWRFTDTIFSYDKADSTAGNSSEILRVNEYLTFKPATNLFLKLEGSLSHSEFKDINEIQDSYGYGFNIDWIPVTWCKLGLVGSHYKISGDSEKTVEKEITAIFEMSYSIWNISLRYSYFIRKDDIIDEAREINNLIFEIIKVNF